MADVPDPQLLSFRDTLARILPSWMQGPRLGGLMFSAADQLDAMVTALAEGVQHRFPGRVDGQSLPRIGRDRRIRRGRQEADDIYASRLLRWWDDRKRKGNPYAMLEQLDAHYAAAPIEIQLLHITGRRYTLDTDRIIVRDDFAWDPGLPSADTAKWSQWWMFMLWPDDVTGDGLWGDPGVWGDGGIWGIELTADEINDIRFLPRDWNSAHTSGTIYMVPPADHGNDPNDWIQAGYAQIRV